MKSNNIAKVKFTIIKIFIYIEENIDLKGLNKNAM